MFKKLSQKIYFMATFLLFTLPIGAANTNGEDVSEKVVMQNYEKINEAYSSLSDILFDICAEANELNNYDQIDLALETADKISVILKRLGETAILEVGELPEQPAEKVEEDIVVEKEEGNKDEREQRDDNSDQRA